MPASKSKQSEVGETYSAALEEEASNRGMSVDDIIAAVVVATLNQTDIPESEMFDTDSEMYKNLRRRLGIETDDPVDDPRVTGAQESRHVPAGEVGDGAAAGSSSKRQSDQLRNS